MLVLSRKVGEKIVLLDRDEKIEVTVCAIKGGSVRIGIDAPETIRVLREELLTQMNQPIHQHA